MVLAKPGQSTGVRRDLRSLSVQGSQPHKKAHGPSMVAPSTDLLLWEAFPIRHGGCFPVSGCSGSLSPSWKYLCTTAVPQLSLTELGYQSRQASPCHLVRCPCAGRLWQGLHDLLHVTHGRGQKSTHLMCAPCHQGAVGAAHSTDLRCFLKLLFLFPFSTMYLKHLNISRSPGQFFQCPIWVQDALFSV